MGKFRQFAFFYVARRKDGGISYGDLGVSGAEEFPTNEYVINSIKDKEDNFDAVSITGFCEFRSKRDFNNYYRNR